MAVEVKMCQRQTVKLTLTHKELIELAFAKAQGIGNWKVVSTSVTATTDSGCRSIDLLASGNVTVNLVLEAPAIS